MERALLVVAMVPHLCAVPTAVVMAAFFFFLLNPTGVNEVVVR